MATVIVMGNLTRDPELREVRDSVVCKLSIAENERVRGEKVTTYYNASVWGKAGESAAQYLSTGSPVQVIGDLSVSEYEKRDGTKGISRDVENARCKFVSGGSRRDSAQGAATPAAGDDEEPMF